MNAPNEPATRPASAQLRRFAASVMMSGLIFLVMWNIGAIATGGGPADIVRQTQLIWRLKKLQTT